MWRPFTRTTAGAESSIKKITPSIEIPLMERVIKKKSAGEVVTFDNITDVLNNEYGGKEGFLLMDNKMRDVGFLPFTPGGAAKKTTAELLGAIEGTGASSVVFKSNTAIIHGSERERYLKNYAIQFGESAKLQDIIDPVGSHIRQGQLEYQSPSSPILIRFGGQPVFKRELEGSDFDEIASDETLFSRSLNPKGIPGQTPMNPQVLEELRQDMVNWIKDVVPLSVVKRMKIDLTPGINTSGMDTAKTEQQWAK
ncbi:MAG: hypothetical protein JRE23_13770, partial [Deltaproteobacteria bacterium]|nr:hypothetical protein [Deltaproteobacteria bacterium]